MSGFAATILEMRSAPLEISLDCSGFARPQAGQYLLASCSDPGDVLPTPLFPTSPPGMEMRFAPSQPPDWYPGQRLQLRGPLGNGFSLPHGFRRLVLAALDCDPASLYPLVAQALAQAAAVTIHTAAAPAGLADDVEILPFENLPDSLAWADALCAALPLASLAKFRRLAGLKVHQPFPVFAQALVFTPLACGGWGDCGVCAVPTRQGWKLACRNGPVFDLNLLEQP